MRRHLSSALATTYFRSASPPGNLLRPHGKGRASTPRSRQFQLINDASGESAGRSQDPQPTAPCTAKRERLSDLKIREGLTGLLSYEGTGHRCSPSARTDGRSLAKHETGHPTIRYPADKVPETRPVRKCELTPIPALRRRLPLARLCRSRCVFERYRRTGGGVHIFLEYARTSTPRPTIDRIHHDRR
jgi:hypothetical protein